MKLTPRYDTPEVLTLDLDLGDPGAAMLRQRRRLAKTMGELDEEQWAHSSRCDDWSVRDVVVHLTTVNQFWAFSVKAGLAGEPTRFLVDFDPVVTPGALVDATAVATSTEALTGFLESNERLAAVVDQVGSDDWMLAAEAPPGHLPIAGVVLHGLWDGWTHERDILLPLGRELELESDELLGCLVYAAALGPLFALSTGQERTGTVQVTATDPSISLVVDVEADRVRVTSGEAPDPDLHLTGSAVDLIEGLSLRAPMPCEVAPEQAWLLEGVARVFDQTT